jgi:competence protein ComGD
MMKKKQHGFTLIESLLVLSIFMIITSVTAFSLKPHSFIVDDNVFLTKLQADLLYAQQYAISHQCEVSVMFSEEQFTYSIYSRYDLLPLVERKYSPNINVYGGSLPLYFKFLTDGNVSKFGSFYIKTSAKNYRVTFLIGKGRFYIIEEK